VGLAVSSFVASLVRFFFLFLVNLDWLAGFDWSEGALEQTFFK
jgi:hypothetical protein